MKTAKALSLAIKALKYANKRYAVDANIARRYGLGVYPHATKARACSDEILEAIKILEELKGTIK